MNAAKCFAILGLGYTRLLNAFHEKAASVKGQCGGLEQH